MLLDVLKVAVGIFCRTFECNVCRSQDRSFFLAFQLIRSIRNVSHQLYNGYMISYYLHLFLVIYSSFLNHFLIFSIHILVDLCTTITE